MLPRQLEVERRRRIGDDSRRLRDRLLDTLVGHAALDRGELVAAEKEPGSGIGTAREARRIGDQTTVEREVGRAFECRHAGNLPSPSDAGS